MFEEFYSRLIESDPFNRVIHSVKSDGHAVIHSLAGSLSSWMAGALFRYTGQTCLLIAPDEYAHILLDDLEECLPPDQIVFFPARDTGVYDDFLPDHQLMTQRMLALYRLVSKSGPLLVITTPKALIEKTIPSLVFHRNILAFKLHDDIYFELVVEAVQDLGYTRNDMVRFPGDYAVRGGLIDLYPLDSHSPVRLEFLGDTIDSIRYFDPITQRSSSQPLTEVTIYPTAEIIYQQHYISQALDTLKREGGDHYESLYAKLKDKIEKRQLFPGGEKYLYYYYGGELGSMIDFLPQPWMGFWLNPGHSEKYWREFMGDVESQYTRKISLDPFLPPPDKILFTWEKFMARIGTIPQIKAYNFGLVSSEEGVEYSSTLTGNFSGNLDQFRHKVNLYAQQGYREYLCCDNPGQRQRLIELMPEIETQVEMIVGHTSQGFRDRITRMVVYTDHELFSKLPRRKIRKKSHELQAPMDLHSLYEDDYVVHTDYGIGQYKGLKRITLNQSEYDCLLISYQGDDKLYVPIDQITRIEKYSHKDCLPPIINKLGTVQWQKIKEKTRKAIEEMAEELLELYAVRRSQPGFAFLPDDIRQKELEAAFLYEETDDQIKAIYEVKKDMENTFPMDRLICGDVGFGKTEVAVRAAFKCISSGKQVAVLVPTTILAQQHYITFKERLDPFSIRVEVLSRFVSDSDQKKILKELKAGHVDLVIGTHRLISSDVVIPNLGLLIIDEEQRFGVKQKERIKKFRQLVDVLTLTATPIPRTMHLSMMGARDITIIETPPRDRLSIQTEIIYFDKEVLREAVLRELNRGGQVFWVHNRIQSLYKLAPIIKEIVPGVRLGIAHGQMENVILEDVMLKFIRKEIDVLLATMIIENGLDIPNVNTIIVDLAERMGLAQLYQLRGRVGRSNLQAYAYLIVPPIEQLTDDAIRRIEALKEFSELGSGMALAMRDMEIRGIGNVLGPQQHGFMQAIGYDLYSRLLDETVQRLKGGKTDLTRIPEVQVQLKAYLDSSYINEDSLRIYFYQKLMKSRSHQELDALNQEIQDRFGQIPTESLHLFLKQHLALSARSLGFDKLIIRSKQILGIYDLERVPSQSVLIKIVASSPVPVLVKSSQVYGIEFMMINAKKEVEVMLSGREIFDQIEAKILSESQ